MAEKKPVPKWNGEVKDSDPCQAVREKKPGGELVTCKGNKCAEGEKCKNLKKRKWPNGKWEDPGDPEYYDSDYEYKCECAK